VPKITDFGLAKRLEGQGQTQTGQVMGTPSYMAPEQAAGRTHEVGPLADVWALGTILYEMLTGRPPFAGDSVHQTLEQVLAHDPAPPRRLERSVPRDLETICLKCLQKDPQRRYSSAGDLAEDLRRFQSGEPIRARPVSGAERLLKWVRRRPARAALAAASVLVSLGLLGGGWWQNARLQAERDRATKNFDRVHRVVEEMLNEVGRERAAGGPRMAATRKALLEEALRFYQRLLADESDDPAWAEVAARARQSVADISRMLGKDAQKQRATDARPVASKTPP
jgi:hypothetical protein